MQSLNPILKTTSMEAEMIYMWQMTRGCKEYRFQTDQRDIHQRMKRREKFHLVGEGINCRCWIYQTEISRPDIARKILKTLAGSKVNFDSETEIFYSEGILSGVQNSSS